MARCRVHLRHGDESSNKIALEGRWHVCEYPNPEEEMESETETELEMEMRDERCRHGWYWIRLTKYYVGKAEKSEPR